MLIHFKLLLAKRKEKAENFSLHCGFKYKINVIKLISQIIPVTYQLSSEHTTKKFVILRQDLDNAFQMNKKEEICIRMRKCLHEIAGEIGIVMAYVNTTFGQKLSREDKELGEYSVSSLSKVREEINNMRDYLETVETSDHGEKK